MVDIYRVTRNRKHYVTPSVKLRSKRSVTSAIAYEREYVSYHGRKPDERIIKIERAPIGEFTDVTAEFLGEGA